MAHNKGYWIFSHSFSVSYTERFSISPIDDQIALWLSFGRNSLHEERLGFIRTHASKYRFTKINAQEPNNDVLVVDAFLNEQDSVLYRMKFSSNSLPLYSMVTEDNPYKFEHIDTIDNA